MLHRASLRDVIDYAAPLRGDRRALGRDRGAVRDRSMRRGSSGGGAAAAFTPASIASTKFWHDDRDIISSAGDITDWYDQLGAVANVDYTQATSGNRMHTGRTVNALPVLDANLSTGSDFMSVPVVTFDDVFDAGEMWVDCIAVFDAGASGTSATGLSGVQTIIGNASGGWWSIAYIQDGVGGYTAQFYLWDTAARKVYGANGSIVVGTPVLIRVRHQGGNIYCKVGSSAESAPVACGNVAAGGLTSLALRIFQTYTAAGFGIDGAFIADAGGTTPPTAGERAQLDAYWAAEYGVAV